MLSYRIDLAKGESLWEERKRGRGRRRRRSSRKNAVKLRLKTPLEDTPGRSTPMEEVGSEEGASRWLYNCSIKTCGLNGREQRGRGEAV